MYLFYCISCKPFGACIALISCSFPIDINFKSSTIKSL